MSDPLPISVVIPAYQAEACVARAVASVRAQTRLPREIIVVDDGSRDRTADVARSLGATVYSQTNRGVSAARNTGILRARQPWIALLDADDRWLPDKLAAQWDALALTGDRVCATDFSFVHPDGSRSDGSVANNRGYRSIEEIFAAPNVVHLTRAMLARALPVGMFLLPSTLLFERRIASEGGERFGERARLRSTAHYHIPEDLEWMLRVLRYTDVTLVKRALADYAVMPSGLSSNVGRMRYGDAKLGQLVCAESDRYVQGAAHHMLQQRASRLREATLQFLRQLEFGAAGVVAREAFFHTARPTDGLLWAFSGVLRIAPIRAVALTMRRTWRRGLKRSFSIARVRTVPD